MNGTINIAQALKDEVARLRRVLAQNIKVGETFPGDSQVKRIEALIDQLDDSIKLSDR